MCAVGRGNWNNPNNPPSPSRADGGWARILSSRRGPWFANQGQRNNSNPEPSPTQQPQAPSNPVPVSQNTIQSNASSFKIDPNAVNKQALDQNMSLN